MDDDLLVKRQTAQKAMEGSERTERREREEREQEIRDQQRKLRTRIDEIVKEREELELSWITLDDKRRNRRLLLTPVLTEEKEAEELEAKLEVDEARAALPLDKEKMEKARWLAQEKRHQIEEKKWSWQEELWAAENKIEENTKKYRALLEEEDGLQTKIDELEKTLVAPALTFTPNNSEVHATQ